ncbi:MAG TPA: PIN domain-containing protein [Terriglobales bacterium]|jgi:predicted nucleic acid-binding protein
MSTGVSTFFADSNLLIYWQDTAHPEKQMRAAAWVESLWLKGQGRLSWQVLHEFYWNATRKLRVENNLARGIVRELAQWSPVDTSLGLVESAWSWSERAQVPYWDGLILAAAERCEATYLLTEDFTAGRRYGDCTVLNPFTADPDEYLPAT